MGGGEVGLLAIVVLLPLRILGLSNNKQDLVCRSSGPTGEPHACALKEFIALESIAFTTGDNHVVPGIPSSSAFWNNVVDSKLSRRTAVLASALVAGVYHGP